MAASMALQVVVSPILGVLFDNLTSPIYKEFGLLWGVDSELKKLTSTLSALQSVLADAEEKQVTNKVIADWLLKIKDAAYDADDILDEWATESGTKEHATQVGIRTTFHVPWILLSSINHHCYLLHAAIAAVIYRTREQSHKLFTSINLSYRSIRFGAYSFDGEQKVSP